MFYTPNPVNSRGHLKRSALQTNLPRGINLGRWLIGKRQSQPRFHEGKISHTVFRSDPEIPPMSPYLLYCQDILHMPQENLPVSIPMPQPLEHNQNVCHGCIQNVFYYPIPRVVDHFQNTYSSDRTVARHTLHQRDCPIALLKKQTNHPDAQATNPNNDMAYPSAPTNNPPPADHPERFANTTHGENEIRSPDRSTDNRSTL